MRNVSIRLAYWPVSRAFSWLMIDMKDPAPTLWMVLPSGMEL